MSAAALTATLSFAEWGEYMLNVKGASPKYHNTITDCAQPEIDRRILVMRRFDFEEGSFDGA